MRRIAILLLLVSLAGCKNTTGPLASKKKPEAPDPLYNSEQQQRWSRERFPLLENDSRVAPNTYTDRYGPTGR